MIGELNSTSVDSVQLQKKAWALRLSVLRTALNAGKGHVPPAFSWSAIAAVLFYGGVGNFFANTEGGKVDRDRFILSKGHGCLTLYAVLADLGLITLDDLNEFAGDGSILPGHPDFLIPGVDTVSGSLGHGLGVACGLSLAARLDNSRGRAVVLMGDGECHEGSIWEAAMFASHHGLGNLTAIVDRNMLGATDFTEEIVSLEPLASRFESFGWDVLEVDGHDIGALITALSPPARRPGDRQGDRPVAIIARTVKGRGVPLMENAPDWHHQLPKGDDAAEAIRILESRL